MININMSDYIKYSLQKGYPLELKWFLTLFSVLENKFDTDFFKYDGKDVILKTDNETIYETDRIKKGLSLLEFNDEIEIDKDFLVNVNSKTKTTVGRLVMNWLIGTYCFNNKIPYINEAFTFKKVEKLIEPLLGSNDENSISIEEYKKFLDLNLYITSFANYYSVGVTEHSLKPAPGIKEYRNKVIKELEKKHGKNALKDPIVFKELEDKLMEYDKKYLESDISYGKLINKKVLTARKRMYGVFGMTGNLATDKKTFIKADLASGIQKNKEDISSYINNNIYGSFSRGNETKDMGVLTKNIIRSTSDVIVNDTDCKTTLTLKTKVKDTETLLSKYIIENNKLVLLTKDNINNYMNKEVNLRDPLFCKSETGVCIYCIGENYRGHEQEVPMEATSLGGEYLNASLKKFHGVELKTTKLPDDLIE